MEEYSWTISIVCLIFVLKIRGEAEAEGNRRERRRLPSPKLL